MSRSGVLVVCLPAVGDFVRCLTAVRMIAERHPGEPIDVLGSPPGSISGRFSPDIRHVYEFQRRSGRLDFGVRLRVAREIRQARHATAYVLATNLKAALIPFLAGIPRRIGWYGEFRYPLVNRPRFGLDHNDPPLLKDHAALFTGRWDIDPASLPPPRLQVPREAIEACRREAGLNPRDRIVAMVAGGDRRAWSIEKSVEFARHCRHAGWIVWLIGAARDRPATQAIAAAVPGVRDMTHSPLDDAIVRIASADVFVGTDTGLTHIAAALGRPVVAIYAAWFQRHSGPINPQVRYILDQGADHHTMFDNASLTARIGVDEVFAEVATILVSDPEPRPETTAPDASR